MTRPPKTLSRSLRARQSPTRQRPVMRADPRRRERALGVHGHGIRRAIRVFAFAGWDHLRQVEVLR